MRRRRVLLSTKAKSDLRQLHRYIVFRGAPKTAGAYVKRIVAFARSLDVAPERGIIIPVPGANIRGIAFESVVLAIRIREHDVTVVRVYHASQDWQRSLLESFAPPAND